MDISRQLQEEMGAPTVEHARDRVRKFLKRYPQPTAKVEPVREAKAQKHEALENLTPRRHVLDWDGARVIRFGLMGDTQINSKYTQLSHLHRFYDICAKLDIDRA